MWGPDAGWGHTLPEFLGGDTHAFPTDQPRGFKWASREVKCSAKGGSETAGSGREEGFRTEEPNVLSCSPA